MNSVIEARIEAYLQREFLVATPPECGAVLDKMRSLARMAGFDLDEQFAEAGLAAGPEARVASAIVARALGRGGCGTPIYTIRKCTQDWLRKSPVRAR